jgi:hypothetical protein
MSAEIVLFVSWENIQWRVVTAGLCCEEKGE